VKGEEGIREKWCVNCPRFSESSLKRNEQRIHAAGGLTRQGFVGT